MPDVTRSHADPAATGGDPTPAAASPPAHSRYTIGEEIARGGMGEVYRATDAVLNREVAVKVLQAKYAPTSVTARRFADEARITAQLQHPNIPAVHDLGTLPDGRPFLAMKLIKGNTLDTLLKARPDPTADRGRFVAVFEQIAHALAYAHAHGVLHRDLKPANVMVGAFNETQVMDWGLAKVLGERRDMHPPANEDEDDPDATRTPDPTDVKSLRDSDDLFTQAGSVLGTPAFMAPEQAIGAVDKIDRRSDVFGLGAILTVVLTGRPPFLGDSAESTRQLAAMGKVADCFALLDTCGAEPELVALCKWCLSTDPSDRPADAGEVATAVASLRAAADERARAAEIDREKATVQAAEQRKRRRVVQWAGVVTAAVLLAGVAGTAVGLFEARKQEAEATKQAGIAQENEAVAKRQELLARAETAKAKTATAAETVAKERAIKSRDQALGALRDTTSTDVELLLGEKKDLTANEKNYLEAIAKRWQAFAKQDGADEQSRVIQAEGHHRVGYLWLRLGRQEQALQEYERAGALQEKLATDFPAVPEYRSQLANSHNSLGTLLVYLGKWGKAEEQFRKGLALREKLVADFPAMPEYRQNLAASQANLGLLLSCHGKRDEAEGQYRKALALHEKLAADFPAVPEYRFDLAHSHDNLGNLLSEVGKRPEAEEQYRKALALQEKLTADFPAVPEYRMRLAASQANLGNLLCDHGDRAEAETQYRKALVIQEKLTADFPAVPEYRSQLANSHKNLGRLLSYVGKWGEAEGQCRKTLVIQEKLAADFPTVPQYRRDLAIGHSNLGSVISELGMRPEAEEQYRKALVIQEKLSADFPAIPEYRSDLANSHNNLGFLLHVLGKSADSLGWFDKAIAILRPIHEAEPQNVTVKSTLNYSYANRALANDTLQKYVEAVKDWDKAVELRPKEEQPPFLANRAFSKVRAGQVAEAVAEVVELRKLPDWSSDHVYNFACTYAIASTKIANKKKEYADTAVELLQQAVKAGYNETAHMKTDTDLDPLRDREDFKKLLAELEKKFPPKQEVRPPPRADK